MPVTIDRRGMNGVQIAIIGITGSIRRSYQAFSPGRSDRNGEETHDGIAADNSITLGDASMGRFE